MAVTFDRKTTLKKYFAGEGSEAERQLIEQFLLSEENPSLSEYLKAEWEATPTNVIPDHAIAEERYKRVLKAIGGRKRIRQTWYWAAAAILLVVLTPVCYVKFMQAKSSGLQWVTVQAGAGEQKDLVLPDGSHVWLNSASAVSYPKTFDSHERRISLTGEAFFSVIKNPEKPFIVAFNNHYTRVLGTSFNIKAYPGDEQQRVTVIEGRVAVGEINDNDLHQYTVLNHNESVTLSLKPHDYTKNVLSDTRDIVAWKKGEIQFHETLLPLVVDELKRRYNANLVLQEKPNTKMPSFTVLIKPQTSLDDVLEILSITKKISYQKRNGKIIITPN